MALKHVMINDIIAEHSARMQNLKKYYPFFVLNETTFTQYKEGKYAFLDMGYITMASLRFFINENNFSANHLLPNLRFDIVFYALSSHIPVVIQ